MEETKPVAKNKGVFKFDSVALIVGFIVDVITLTSIVFSLHIPDINESLPKFISTGLAFSIWLLAVYLYLAFLHSFWESHKSDKNYAEKFSLFLADDLLFRFRNPPLLFPAIVALVTLFWIASTESSGFLVVLFAVILGIVGIPILIGAYVYIHDTKVEAPKEANIPVEFKERVNKEWKFLSKHINEYLANQIWVSSEDLSTIATVWEVPEQYMNYVLAQFAIKNHKRARFGYLYSRVHDTPVNFGEKVLINLESLNYEKYYYL